MVRVFIPWKLASVINQGVCVCLHVCVSFQITCLLIQCYVCVCSSYFKMPTITGNKILKNFDLYFLNPNLRAGVNI